MLNIKLFVAYHLYQPCLNKPRLQGNWQQLMESREITSHPCWQHSLSLKSQFYNLRHHRIKASRTAGLDCRV